jgi:hypothetical protein
MRLRHGWLALAFALVPIAAHAHGHTADVFAAFRYADGSSLRGGRATYAYVIPRSEPDAVRFWSLVGDVGFLFGEHDGVDVGQVALSGGIRATYARSTTAAHLPFAQLLLGGLHTQDGLLNPTDFALDIGLGYEWAPVARPVSVRIQFDYVRSGGQNFPGFSVGIVHRFKKEP